jgi:histone-binding protein RBBP4
MIASVKLPKDEPEVDLNKYEESAESSANGDQFRIQINSRICHPGEINRALHNPRNPFLIATKTVSGEVLLFDYSKHPSKPKEEGVCLAQMTLTGHTEEGFALDWNNANQIASGADDALICVWDVNNAEPVVRLVGHSKPVESISWSFDNTTLLSGSDDRRILLWDTRNPGKPVLEKIDGHSDDINSVDFSPFTPFLFATGSSDKQIHLWDSRRMTSPVYTLSGGHVNEITNLKFHPKLPQIIGSSGTDRRVAIWDLGRIGGELHEDDAEDGPVELAFRHCGHTGRVNDFSFNGDWTVASVADDNILQIWTPNRNIYTDDE